jgi:hypothetical protein
MIATAAFVFGTLALLVVANARLNPPDCHNCITACDSGYGEFLIGLCALFTVSAAGLFFRLCWARVGLIAAAAVYVVWAIILGLSVASVRFAIAEHPDELRSVTFWWQVTWPALAAVTALAIATWYLFSSRTQEYFSSVRKTHV